MTLPGFGLVVSLCLGAGAAFDEANAALPAHADLVAVDGGFVVVWASPAREAAFSGLTPARWRRGRDLYTAHWNPDAGTRVLHGTLRCGAPPGRTFELPRAVHDGDELLAAFRLRQTSGGTAQLHAARWSLSGAEADCGGPLQSNTAAFDNLHHQRSGGRAFVTWEKVGEVWAQQTLPSPGAPTLVSPIAGSLPPGHSLAPMDGGLLVAWVSGGKAGGAVLGGSGGLTALPDVEDTGFTVTVTALGGSAATVLRSADVNTSGTYLLQSLVLPSPSVLSSHGTTSGEKVLAVGATSGGSWYVSRQTLASAFVARPMGMLAEGMLLPTGSVPRALATGPRGAGLLVAHGTEWQLFDLQPLPLSSSASPPSAAIARATSQQYPSAQWGDGGWLLHFNDTEASTTTTVQVAPGGAVGPPRQRPDVFVKALSAPHPACDGALEVGPNTVVITSTCAGSEAVRQLNLSPSPSVQGTASPTFALAWDPPVGKLALLRADGGQQTPTLSGRELGHCAAFASGRLWLPFLDRLVDRLQVLPIEDGPGAALNESAIVSPFQWSASSLTSPCAAADGDGGVLIVAGRSHPSVSYQLLDVTDPSAPEVRHTTTITLPTAEGSVHFPVAVYSSVGWVIAWEHALAAGSIIQVRLVRDALQPQGPVLTLTPQTSGAFLDARNPWLAAAPGGGVLAAWNEYQPETGRTVVRHRVLAPAVLTGDAGLWDDDAGVPVEEDGGAPVEDDGGLPDAGTGDGGPGKPRGDGGEHLTTPPAEFASCGCSSSAEALLALALALLSRRRATRSE